MLVKNGRVLSPHSRLDLYADVRVEGDRILAVAPDLEPLENETVLDASGCIVAPGLVDTHVHFRDPGFTYKEDLHTGALAAAAGGFTTVLCMANTKPPVDSPEVLQDILHRASGEPVRIRQAASATKGMQGKELTDFAALKEAGAAAFTDDGIPLTDASVVLEAMKQAKVLQVPLSFHEEDPSMIVQSGSNLTAPNVAEDLLVARDCMLALHTGATVCIQHISSKASVALVRAAKQLGAPVWAEATPHHFSLTQEAVAEYGTLAKMNPPLRTEEDRMAVIHGLQDGTIDMIVTDHAPHSAEEKGRPFPSAPSGITGLETSLALGITNLVRPGYLSLPQLMEKMSLNPSKLYGFPAMGICEGAPADLVVFDEKADFCRTAWYSKASNTPFAGRHLTGAVRFTVCRGRVVYSAF